MIVIDKDRLRPFINQSLSSHNIAAALINADFIVCHKSTLAQSTSLNMEGFDKLMLRVGGNSIVIKVEGRCRIAFKDNLVANYAKNNIKKQKNLF